MAKYEYDENGIVVAIFGKNAVGEWIEMSENTSFVGTLNLIRLHSYYYDSETNWYYDGLYYYNPTNNEYIVPNAEGTVKVNVSQSLIVTVSDWRTELMNTPSFGKSISFSSGWYNSLSDVEILSRLIYGENTMFSIDQNAVGWVLVNRKKANSTQFGGGTYRGVATKSGAFEPITGGSDGTANARTPNKSNPRWSNAVWIACSLLIANNDNDYMGLFYKPTGISSQLFFAGLNYFLDYSINDSPTGSGILYKMDGTYIDIKDVVIILNSGMSLQNPGTKSTITSNVNLDTFSERNTHNIFFNLD